MVPHLGRPADLLGVSFVIGIFCGLRGKYIETKNTHRVESAMKLAVIFFCILFMGMWIAASVAGASMRLSGTLMGFVSGGFVAMFVWLYLELGHDNLLSASQRSNVVRSIMKFAMSDWARAIFIVFTNFMIPMVMVVNMVNQCIRRCRGTTDSTSRYTDKFDDILQSMKTWNWCSILCKVNILTIVYFILMVGVTRATYIFLSWINVQLQGYDLIIVVIIFFGIGYLMFMLPPVPGVPVYITGGIILTARAETTSLGAWGGTFLALAVGYSLKLLAVVGQWSIGMKLGKSVKIQKMVGVDTVGIRAIEDILKRPGLSFPKIAVLV